ncbi:MAG: hypothetical protein AB7O67_18180 [Vicinamibacterales bacterium]
MSPAADVRLPDVLLTRLGLARADGGEALGIQICTIDGVGFPHPAMLSPLEVVAMDARRLRLAVWPAHRTARHLRDDRRVALMYVDEGLACYIKGLATPLPPISTGEARFEVVVTAVSLDRPDPTREGAARITAGIRIAGRVVEPESLRRRLEAIAG